ncbi:MAG: uroporphyrinogen-III synthase [Pseudomonadales bacterium]|nr:uroporphyrinogen-III synthase [Pseudomonadales bacterium]
MPDQPFSGKTIALPESRMLDVLANLFEQRGAQTLRCPLVSIHDTDNREAADQWIRDFIETPPDDFIIFTGEGIRRLLKFSEQIGLRESFITAISQTRTLARGPKPTAALRSISMTPSLTAAHPSTDGIISTFESLNLEQRRVSVQLYGQEPNHKLIHFLEQKDAIVETVAPYLYASESEQQQVEQLIEALIQHKVDAMVFTSTTQLNRLLKVSTKLNVQQALIKALNSIKTAAVGPVVGDALVAANIQVDFMPENKFFMKPMVAEMARGWR